MVRLRRNLLMLLPMLSMVMLLSDQAASQETLAPSLAGRWVSEQPEPLPGKDGDVNYLMREFEFTGDRWSIVFTIFDDEARTKPLLQGRNAGTYILSGPLSDESQAAIFRFVERELKPATESMANALSAAKCGAAPWRSEETQSVFDRGCASFRVFARSECAAEYDIVALRHGKLLLGARPADGLFCSPERRPVALGLPLIMAP